MPVTPAEHTSTFSQSPTPDPSQLEGEGSFRHALSRVSPRILVHKESELVRPLKPLENCWTVTEEEDEDIFKSREEFRGHAQLGRVEPDTVTIL